CERCWDFEVMKTSTRVHGIEGVGGKRHLFSDADSTIHLYSCQTRNFCSIIRLAGNRREKPGFSRSSKHELNCSKSRGARLQNLLSTNRCKVTVGIPFTETCVD